MARVLVDNVTKAYGAVQVLHGVSIDIADGEFVILVGPSGCGKSTLLRMLAGLEDISGGEISIGARVVNNLEPKERDIAMVFQNYALYPHMTVAENMTFALRLAGASKTDIQARLQRASEILSLEQLLGRYPKQLSGGQRQRVAMGRAIVRDPQVFLFDEPLSNLDAKLRVQMRTEIKALHQRLKTTTIYVTHDQVEAMTMADRIVVMNAGEVEQIGSPLDLYDHPANLFVAGFIGSPGMNLLEGEVVGSANGPVFRTRSGVKLGLPGSLQNLGLTGPHVLGVRPEHVSLVADGDIEARVLVVEPTGAETQVVMQMGTQTLTGVFRDRLDLPYEAPVRLRFDFSKVHLFDERTGANVIPPQR